MTIRWSVVCGVRCHQKYIYHYPPVRRDWSPHQWLPREVTASRGGGRAVTFRIVRTVRRGRRAK